MYEISYSKEKNRVHIKISGELSHTEEKNYINDMINCLNNISPNFTVCANLQHCNMSVLHKSSNFEPIRNYGKEKKVYKVAVILSNEAFNANLSKPFNQSSNVFKTIEEAEDYLDN